MVDKRAAGPPLLEGVTDAQTAALEESAEMILGDAKEFCQAAFPEDGQQQIGNVLALLTMATSKAIAEVIEDWPGHTDLAIQLAERMLRRAVPVHLALRRSRRTPRA